MLRVRNGTFKSMTPTSAAINGGTAGRGSEKKVLFIGTVSLDEGGHPLRAKFTQPPGFTRTAIAAWASAYLSPQSIVVSGALARFAGVTDAGCAHQPTVVGGRKPKDLPMFHWVNTALGNLKTKAQRCLPQFRLQQVCRALPRCQRLSLQSPLRPTCPA